MTAAIGLCYAALYARCSTVFAASDYALQRKHPFIKRVSSASARTSQRTKISFDLYRHHDNLGVASLPRDISDNNGNPSMTHSLTPSNYDSRKGITQFSSTASYSGGIYFTSFKQFYYNQAVAKNAGNRYCSVPVPNLI
jgi:hypothetical protein